MLGRRICFLSVKLGDGNFTEGLKLFNGKYGSKKKQWVSKGSIPEYNGKWGKLIIADQTVKTLAEPYGF